MAGELFTDASFTGGPINVDALSQVLGLNRNYFRAFRGAEPGQTTVILGGVHGNEPAGPAAFWKLFPTLKVDRGTVWFGLGDVDAMRLGQRTTAGDFKFNLNRMFVPAD